MTVMETETKQPNFPYVSYPTFKTFISHLHDTVVTDQIDNTMMPAKLSGSARAAITSALKSLGLIDDHGNTNNGLKDLVSAYNTKEWPKAVKDWILSVYGNIIKNIDLNSATRKQIEDLFEDASPQMKDKYIRFFLSANKDADIDYSPHLKIRRRGTGTRKRSSTPVSKKPKSSKATNAPSDETPESDFKPEGCYDQPIPIESAYPCYVRVPRNITPDQIGMVEAAVAFIKAMAEQNKKSK
jgi:hypothetical protein